jgi:acid phosphatase
MGKAVLRIVSYVVVVGACACLLGCGASKSSASAATPTAQTGAAGPAGTSSGAAPTPAASSHHIFVIAEENTSYSNVVGNTSQMPYYNSLLPKGTLWTNYYSNAHGSMLSYIETMSGTSFNCTGNDCGASGALTGPSLMDLMDAQGMAWKGYFDGISSCGQLAPQATNWIVNPDSNGAQNYYQRHTPFPWYAVGTATTTTCKSGGNGWWPVSQLTTDLANHSVGSFNWITPDGTSDGHDGTLPQLDAFMQKNLTPLLASSYFQPGGDGILIIWWDEADLSNNACGGPTGNACGGQIPMTVIGPGIKVNNQDPTPADHDSVSRFIQQQLGFTPSLGNSVNVPDFTQTLN